MAAEASLAANAQNNFWPLHDKMFANYRKLNRESILALAKEAGLDVPKLIADLDSRKYNQTVQKDTYDGNAAGVQGTRRFL